MDSLPPFYALSASQIAKLLQGEKPENLPVQQPTEFELAVSLKNAQAALAGAGQRTVEIGATILLAFGEPAGKAAQAR